MPGRVEEALAVPSCPSAALARMEADWKRSIFRGTTHFQPPSLRLPGGVLIVCCLQWNGESFSTFMAFPGGGGALGRGAGLSGGRRSEHPGTWWRGTTVAVGKEHLGCVSTRRWGRPLLDGGHACLLPFSCPPYPTHAVLLLVLGMDRAMPHPKFLWRRPDSVLRNGLYSEGK